MKTYHDPVLALQTIEGLSIVADGRYADATFGGGGHSALILDRLTTGKLIAFDQDADSAANVPADDRILFLNHNFRYIKNFVKLYGFAPVDGILADLGVSSHQFDQPERGFSTRFAGALDMRMNQATGLSAADILNQYPLEKLEEIFRNYGELPNYRKIAYTLEQYRKTQAIETTLNLKDVLSKYAPRGRENKFFAKVFQALRIEVNQELEALKEFLMHSVEILKPGGRLVVISYHSLEDRLVKNFMKSGNFSGEIEKDFFGNIISPIAPIGKVIVPSEEEIERNSRARSAKLRIAQKRTSD
ncbi:MAG TPA: 16S rRNA (cytosine(1402)-N(4))-methyltransferase [Bacteroidales bacterium]|nr:16S rRNA (cytosine(1402)-N(4))-methyltransferase [Bacteroidales bacterium]